jgi:hypothetical protein
MYPNISQLSSNISCSISCLHCDPSGLCWSQSGCKGQDHQEVMAHRIWIFRIYNSDTLWYFLQNLGRPWNCFSSIVTIVGASEWKYDFKWTDIMESFWSLLTWPYSHSHNPQLGLTSVDQHTQVLCAHALCRRLQVLKSTKGTLQRNPPNQGH